MRKKTGEVRRLLAETLKVEEMLAKKKLVFQLNVFPQLRIWGSISF